MNIENYHMDFEQTVVVQASQRPWLDSPMAGVQRIPLARQGAEQGHATSLVRYAAGSHFRSHRHPNGEEILVLDGVFSDQSGDYPAGSYLRNPPGSEHRPFSELGCTLFVKLQQFQASDDQQIALIQANQFGRTSTAEKLLHQHGDESVSLLVLAAGQSKTLLAQKGALEVLILAGTVSFNGDSLAPLSWLRSSQDMTLTAQSNTTLWLKTGHFALKSAVKT